MKKSKFRSVNWNACKSAFSDGTDACVFTGENIDAFLTLNHIYDNALQLAIDMGYRNYISARPEGTPRTKSMHSHGLWSALVACGLGKFKHLFQLTDFNTNQKLSVMHRRLVAIKDDLPSRLRDAIRRHLDKVAAHRYICGTAPACKSCGVTDSDILDKDHIYEDGPADLAHRKVSAGDGLNRALLDDAASNLPPTRYQLLCKNCHRFKTDTGMLFTDLYPSYTSLYRADLVVEKGLRQYHDTQPDNYPMSVINTFERDYLTGVFVS